MKQLDTAHEALDAVAMAQAVGGDLAKTLAVRFERFRDARIDEYEKVLTDWADELRATGNVGATIGNELLGRMIEARKATW